ncbi:MULTISPECIES: hypothetical protein [unclassified Variovorax]|uniref:hypothetical protein n=1 Tax=unclassified Variovorax TaxID=663243 RepID=UPI00076BEDAB|nr:MULTISPECIES: hypothetical protein [unclassified Variovorax]KWT98378.1 hypothetical protein APY03_0513 [Variovorax sp. WDL1]PNG49962.1 hypothetical protein CHC06_05543 [Variovorax sp. B2]PNG50834.1 hypothetical protein CHC07_05448 [Variovorax sp. B4]VTV18063.1 hypothetical protein WDL1P1_00887 [Variovorax sp. WDL1]
MPNQENQHSDWHRKGHFAVVTPRPHNAVLYDTFSDSAYGARAAFVCEHALIWSSAVKKGYTMAEFTKAGVVVDTRQAQAVEEG